jgi:hypothetical protein
MYGRGHAAPRSPGVDLIKLSSSIKLAGIAVATVLLAGGGDR